MRYAKNRTKISNDLATEVKQLARSKPYQEEIDALQGVTGFLIRSQEEEKERLRTTIDRLLKGSKVVPLDSEILVSARKYQLDHDLSPQDSIIYASVLKHFSTSSSEANCF